MTQEQQAPNPAEAYERVIAQQIFTPWTAELISRAKPVAGERVLDLACGTGIVTRSIASMVGSTGTITALDVAPFMLEVARRLAPTDGPVVEFHEGSGTDMPFANDSFDLVLCQQGLQFFPDPAAGLREIYRVLAPGGRAVIEVWRDLEGQRFMKAMGDLVAKHFVPGAMAVPFSLGDEERLARMARDAGFAEVEVQSQELDIRIPEPESFTMLMLQGAAAVLPEFMKISPEKRQEIMGRMRTDLSGAIQPFIDGNEMVLDSKANILVARP